MDIQSPLNKIFTNVMNNYAAGGHTKQLKKTAQIALCGKVRRIQFIFGYPMQGNDL